MLHRWLPQKKLTQLALLSERDKRIWQPALFALALCLSVVMGTIFPYLSLANPAANIPRGTVVRIGYQKAATILSLLKAKDSLEKAFASAGAKVTWTEFPAGPPLLEALNAGSVDFGYTGEAPPILAQAAGVPVRYVAYDPWGPQAEAIVVPKDSSIRKVTDLKGKRVGVARGSNTHYLTVSALQSVKLKPSDVDFKFLRPADARAAFENKQIDAWAIWDPYLAAAQVQANARIVVDAKGLAPNLGYYLASQSFIDKSPAALRLVLREVRRESDWAKSNPKGVARFLSPELGIDAAILEKAERRRAYGVFPLTPEVIRNQQKIADTFTGLNLIPKSIKIEEAVWKGNFS